MYGNRRHAEVNITFHTPTKFDIVHLNCSNTNKISVCITFLCLLSKFHVSSVRLLVNVFIHLFIYVHVFIYSILVNPSTYLYSLLIRLKMSTNH